MSPRASSSSVDIATTATTATTTIAATGHPRTAQEKSAIRRAQVRRAQSQHRQRKAEYMRQLEFDVDALRGLIDAEELTVRGFRAENATLRAQLGLSSLGGGGDGGGGGTDSSSIGRAAELMATIVLDERTLSSDDADGALAVPTNSESVPSLFDDIDLDELMVSVAVDETLGEPVFQVSGRCGGGSVGRGGSVLVLPAANASDDDDIPFQTDVGQTGVRLSTTMTTAPAYAQMFRPLTEDQTNKVVNFILCLEHVCWGHIGHQFREPADAAATGSGGHKLMVSSLVMRDASPDMFATLERCAPGMAAFGLRDDPDLDAGAAAKPVTGHVRCSSHYTPPDAAAQAALVWPAARLRLETLYGLAMSLNPHAALELTPVQAWFELAVRFPVAEVLLREDVLTMLKRGLAGVVRCLRFGAVMERSAFESVVQRTVVPVAEAVLATSGGGKQGAT